MAPCFFRFLTFKLEFVDVLNVYIIMSVGANCVRPYGCVDNLLHRVKNNLARRTQIYFPHAKSRFGDEAALVNRLIYSH